MFIEDLDPHPVSKLKSIGYLSGDFIMGAVPVGFVQKLKEIVGKICSNPGSHNCPYCNGAKSCSEISAGEYVWPEMLAHYIEVHGYKPPQEFVDFVMVWNPNEDDGKIEDPIKLPDFDF